MSVSRATQARTLHLMVRLVETNSLSSSPFTVLYRLKHLGNCGRAYPVGSEIRYIVHGPRRSERRPLICVSSWKSEPGLDRREKKKEEDVQGDTQVGKLKIQTGLRPRLWTYFTLVQCCREQTERAITLSLCGQTLKQDYSPFLFRGKS